ncbi:MAG: AbiU2 domain-containing protein [Bellilinea sp.]
MDQMKTLPEEIESIVTLIKSEIVWLHGHWRIFQQLFCGPSEIIDLLNNTAPTYFYITQKALFDDIIISLVRLTDKKSTLGYQNISLDQIINCLDENQYPELKAKLEEQLITINELTKSLRNYRSKKLAHWDLEQALKIVEPLEVISLKMINDVLEALGIFMNDLELFFLNSETAYEAFAMRSNGKTIITMLKKSLAYDKLERQGVIEIGYWKR